MTKILRAAGATFAYNMRGTSRPHAKFIGYFGNAIEVIRISDRSLLSVFAKNLEPCNFRLLQHNRRKAARCLWWLREMRIGRASAAHPKCCCASCIAGTLLNGGSRHLLFCSYRFRTEECSSMRVHIDGKPPDGNAIGLVVIILLSVIALEVLLSRLDAFL